MPFPDINSRPTVSADKADSRWLDRTNGIYTKYGLDRNRNSSAELLCFILDELITRIDASHGEVFGGGDEGGGDEK